MTVTDYEVEVRYSFEDKGFLATVREFPNLYYVARTRLAAYDGLQMKLGSVLGARRYSDLAVPRPMATSPSSRW
jgi:predicted RNase H-like HicB family nuclease